MATRTFRIADLWPFEPGAVRASYDYHVRKYQNQEPVNPPVVLDLGNNVWMVIQGNNRTKASKDAGIDEMEFDIGFRQAQELRPFRDTVPIRDAKRQKGFENYPVFNIESDRTAESESE